MFSMVMIDGRRDSFEYLHAWKQCFVFSLVFRAEANKIIS